MTSKRTVVVAVAVAVGVLASVLSYVFLNNAQQNAYHNAKLVPAYVITKPIPRTLSGADAVSGGYLQKQKVPAEFRPSSAVTNVSVIRDEAAGSNLPTGEVVVSGMFVSPPRRAGADSVLEVRTPKLCLGALQRSPQWMVRRPVCATTTTLTMTWETNESQVLPIISPRSGGGLGPGTGVRRRSTGAGCGPGPDGLGPNRGPATARSGTGHTAGVTASTLPDLELAQRVRRDLSGATGAHRGHGDGIGGERHRRSILRP